MTSRPTFFVIFVIFRPFLAISGLRLLNFDSAPNFDPNSRVRALLGLATLLYSVTPCRRGLAPRLSLAWLMAALKWTGLVGASAVPKGG